MTVIQSTPSEQSTSSIKAKCSSSKHKHSKSSMAWGKEALKIVEWSSHSYQFNISTDSGVSIIKCRYEIICIEASRNWRNNYLKPIFASPPGALMRRRHVNNGDNIADLFTKENIKNCSMSSKVNNEQNYTLLP